MGMSEDIMKGGIPDDCNAWTKTGIVECLGTPDEHTDTFYRHGDWGIEEHNEHEFEVYAIVEGKPILVKEGFTTFRECTEFIRGSIASKRLETDVDEKDPENQTPKEEVKMVIKPFRMMMEDIMKADWEGFDAQMMNNRGVLATEPKKGTSLTKQPVVNEETGYAKRSKSRGGHPNDTHSIKPYVEASEIDYSLPKNLTGSRERSTPDLASTKTGDGINPDSERRSEILGEPTLDNVPKGVEVEGFNYNIKPERGQRSSVHELRQEKENKYFDGEKPDFGGDRGLQAAQTHLVDSLAGVLPEDVLTATMSDPAALQRYIREQGPNGDISRQLRGFLVNNPGFQDAWNKLSMGQKQVPGGGVTESYYEDSVINSPLSDTEKQGGAHEELSYSPNAGQPLIAGVKTPEELITKLNDAKLDADDPINMVIRNLIEQDIGPDSAKYISPTETGRRFHAGAFIKDNFDKVMDALNKDYNSRRADQATNNPSLENTGYVDDADYSSSPKTDAPPINSSSSGPALKARKALYPDQTWNRNADLSHETKNLMDALYWFTSEVYPNLKGGPTDSFYRVSNQGSGDNKTSTVQWMSQEQAAQAAQDKFDRSKYGQEVNAINAMPHGPNATPEEQDAYVKASNAFYQTQAEKAANKDAKAKDKREQKKQEEQDRHDANLEDTKQRLADQEEYEHNIAMDRDQLSQKYNEIITAAAKSKMDFLHNVRKRSLTKGLNDFVSEYRELYPEGNFMNENALRDLQAKLEAESKEAQSKNGYNRVDPETGLLRQLPPDAAARRAKESSRGMKVFKKGDESDEEEEDAPSFRDLVKAETDKVDATRGLPTGYRYKPETRVFRDLYRTTVIDGKDDISTVMPKTKD